MSYRGPGTAGWRGHRGRCGSRDPGMTATATIEIIRYRLAYPVGPRLPRPHPISPRQPLSCPSPHRPRPHPHPPGRRAYRPIRSAAPIAPIRSLCATAYVVSCPCATAYVSSDRDRDTSIPRVTSCPHVSPGCPPACARPALSRRVGIPSGVDVPSGSFFDVRCAIDSEPGPVPETLSFPWITPSPQAPAGGGGPDPIHENRERKSTSFVHGFLMAGQ